MATAAPAAGLAGLAGRAGLGRDKSEAERCQECHGADGSGQPPGTPGRFPKLAGQRPGYLLKQFQDFRSGARKHDFMAIMARSVDDADAADIVAYYAALPPMRGEPAPATASLAATHGRMLFEQGDATRGLAACAGCHGAAGKGGPDERAPIVGGQEGRYLERQLLDWRTGERRNDPTGAMSQHARKLTDADIQALADYLAAQ